MDNETINEKPFYPVKLDSYLIPIIIECFGEEVDKVEYPDGSIDIIFRDISNGQ